MGRRLQQDVPEREDRDRGQGLLDRAAGAGRGHGPVRSDVAPDEGAEIDAFEKKYGYKPAAIRGAVDALAVFVHKDNPIQCLTLQQVDAVFSKTRKGGSNKEAATWGDLGLTGEWAAKPVSLYGRNSASGTYGYFKEVALFNGDFKDAVKEQPGSSTVVQGVASDKFAMGYSGIGYATADVRAVPLAGKAGEKCAPATAAAAYAGEYPSPASSTSMRT